MNTHRCSICGKIVPPEGNLFTPFCSQRCQQLDLSHWLGERYGLPWEDPSKETESDIGLIEPEEPDEPSF